MFSRDERLNQIVLKGLVPAIVILVVLLERRIVLNNSSLSCYLIFFLWATLSVFYSVNDLLTFRYLQVILGNILLWYGAYRLSIYIRRLDVAFWLIATTFIFHALVAVLFPSSGEGGDFGRASGLYDNPNALGFAMWYGIVFLTYFLLSTPGLLRRSVLLGLIVLCVWVMFSTGSRKSFLALLVFIFVLFLFLLRTRMRLVAVALFLVCFISYDSILEFLFTETAVGARMMNDSLERGAISRTQLIQEGLELFFRYPVLGVGLGSFTSYSSSGLMAHNDYIEIVSSMGLVGLMLYMPIFWYFLKDCRVVLKDRTVFFLGAVSLSFLAGYLVLGMGRPAFLDPFAIVVFATLQVFTLKYSRLYQWKRKLLHYEDLSNHQHAQLG